MAALRPLRSAQGRQGCGAAGSFPSCPHCRANGNDQWWLLVSELGNELLTGASLNSSGTFVAKAGVCADPIGNYYAAYGGTVSKVQWDTSTSKSVYAHFWTTAQPGPMNKFFDEAGYALDTLQMDMHYHRTLSKSHGEFGMQCRRCGMSLVISWPRTLTSSEAECAQQLLAAFVHPQPYQLALLDRKPDETDLDGLVDAAAPTAGSKVCEVERMMSIEAN